MIKLFLEDEEAEFWVAHERMKAKELPTSLRPKIAAYQKKFEPFIIKEIA